MKEGNDINKDKSNILNNLEKNIEILIVTARKKVYQDINTSLLECYWNIGKLIIEVEQCGNNKAEYGKSLVLDLSRILINKFGKGFSKSNLFSMRNFYEKEIINSNWSVREFKRQLDTSLYQRLLLSNGIANKERILELAREGNLVKYPQDLIKDPYVFEFL